MSQGKPKEKAKPAPSFKGHKYPVEIPLTMLLSAYGRLDPDLDPSSDFVLAMRTAYAEMASKKNMKFGDVQETTALNFVSKLQAVHPHLSLFARDCTGVWDYRARVLDSEEANRLLYTGCPVITGESKYTPQEVDQVMDALAEMWTMRTTVPVPSTPGGKKVYGKFTRIANEFFSCTEPALCPCPDSVRASIDAELQEFDSMSDADIAGDVQKAASVFMSMHPVFKHMMITEKNSSTLPTTSFMAILSKLEKMSKTYADELFAYFFPGATEAVDTSVSAVFFRLLWQENGLDESGKPRKVISFGGLNAQNTQYDATVSALYQVLNDPRLRALLMACLHTSMWALRLCGATEHRRDALNARVIVKERPTEKKEQPPANGKAPPKNSKRKKTGEDLE